MTSALKNLLDDLATEQAKFNAAREYVRKKFPNDDADELDMDSLAYWHNEMLQEEAAR